MTKFGLNMDAAILAELFAAIRDQWPTETAGLSDERAAQTVLKLIFADVMARHRAKQAVPDQSAAVQQAIDAIAEQQQTALESGRQQVIEDVQVTAP